jgi:2-dehydro-3-deoxyphosphogluconate aldolase / (4S)-4-hydroxy-2-oxoglutarate aldolase
MKILDIESITSSIQEYGVIAVIRMTDGDRVKRVVEAVVAGGVHAIEITMTVPNAASIIEMLQKDNDGSMIIGAGTVTDSDTAVRVIESGAQYVVSPILDQGIIATCSKHDVLCIPGCYTPTEIFTARKSGADIVKLFPATSLGPNFIKDIHGPFPDLQLIPTGGVTVDNVGSWITAGAAAVGIGSDLLNKEAIKNKQYEVLTERAKLLVSNIKTARRS